MRNNKFDIEIFMENMNRLQEEKAGLSDLLRAQTAEVDALRKDNTELREYYRREMEKMRESHRKDIEELRESYERKMADMQKSFEKRLDRMAEVNAGMAQQLTDALSSGKLARAKKYARSTEQRNLLNNRQDPENRKEQEDDSDGTPPTQGPTPGSETPASSPSSPARKRGNRRKSTPEGKMRFDEIVEHPMSETMAVPEGARLLPGTNWYEVVDYIPGRIVCHRYEYQRYYLPDPDKDDRDCFGDTLPDSIKAMCPAKGCSLSASLMAFIMMQRYAYHLPQKRIKMMLRDMGVHIPKSTLNRFFMNGADALLAMLGKRPTKGTLVLSV